MSYRGIARYNTEFLSYVTRLNNKRLIDREDFWKRRERERETLEIVNWTNQGENVHLKKKPYNLTTGILGSQLYTFSKKEVYTLFSTPTGSLFT